MSSPTLREMPTRTLAEFLTGIQFEQLPREVVSRTEEYFLDWLGSALAGRNARPVQILERFATAMGPGDGASEILVSRRRTSPYFAAMVNAAASHYVEQDDLHNSSVLHPGTVVFPAVVAAAQHLGSTGPELLTAAVAGYEAGIRIGEFLGRSHYRTFHTTGTVGTLAAAAGVARLLNLDGDQTLQALGSAGTQAAGLWEFLRDAADSKQLHTAKAAANGLLSAYIARDGFTGARRILEGTQGMAAGMSDDADPAKLVDSLGRRWAIAETSLKFHASCRHTHPAADALLGLMAHYNLKADAIEKVCAHVHQGAIDVLGPVTDPQTVHQSKFSMGFVLALIALYGQAGINEFTEKALRDPAVRAFHDRVEMVFDETIDRAYPSRWMGHVEVTTVDGRQLDFHIEYPKGDPQNPLNRRELEEKVMRLGLFQNSATEKELNEIIAMAWGLREAPAIGCFLQPGPSPRAMNGPV